MSLQYFAIDITIIADELEGENLRNRVGAAVAEILKDNELLTNVTSTGFGVTLSAEEAEQIAKEMG